MEFDMGMDEPKDPDWGKNRNPIEKAVKNPMILNLYKAE